MEEMLCSCHQKRGQSVIEADILKMAERELERTGLLNMNSGDGRC